jgi:hypothetical protein
MPQTGAGMMLDLLIGFCRVREMLVTPRASDAAIG